MYCINMGCVYAILNGKTVDTLHKHTHTHTHIYIYIYIKESNKNLLFSTHLQNTVKIFINHQLALKHSTIIKKN